MTDNGSGPVVEGQDLAGLLALNTLGIQGTQYQSLKMRLDLFEETVFLTRYRDGNPSQVYEIAPLDLAAAFADVPVGTPVLPRRCLFWSKSGSEERVGIYLPPVTWGLWLSGRKRRAHIPLPGLVFVGQGAGYRLWAVKHPRNRGNYAGGWQPCETDRLYHAPLPNVNPVENTRGLRASSGSGGLCQGSAEFPLAATSTIYEAVGALFDSEWSDHWVNGKSEAEPEDVRKMYPKVRRLGYWPAEDLVETGWVLGQVAEFPE